LFDSSDSLGRFGEQLIPAPDFSGSLFEPSLSGHSDSAGDNFLTNDSDRPLMGPVPPPAPWHMTTSMPFDPQDDTVKSKHPVSAESKVILTRRFPTRRMAPRLPHPLHDRSQSFSFCQGPDSLFSNKNNGSDTTRTRSRRSWGTGRRATTVTGRSRALSNTVFQRALSPTGQPPGADINNNCCLHNRIIRAAS
jgi:hypothetical protein